MAAVTLKLKYEGVIRRVPLKASPPSIDEVHGVITTLFSLDDNYELFYTDDEGDKIVVSSDVELAEARALAGSSVFYLDLEKIQKAKPATPQPQPQLQHLRAQLQALLLERKPEDFVHHAICDVCDQQIKHIRYKCAVCADYDLCSTCEKDAATHHPKSHAFLKLTPASAHCAMARAQLQAQACAQAQARAQAQAQAQAQLQAQQSRQIQQFQLQQRQQQQQRLQLQQQQQLQAQLQAQAQAQAQLQAQLQAQARAEVEAQAQAQARAQAEAEPENEDRARALAVLLPMGFDVDVVNALLDIVEGDLDAALVELGLADE